MTTIYLPLPASVFSLKDKFEPNSFQEKLEAYANKHSGLSFSETYEEALEIVNKEERAKPWVIVQYDSNSNYQIDKMWCLKRSDYTKKVPYDVISVNPRWMLFVDGYTKLDWPVECNVGKDLFLQAAGELRPEQHYLLDAIIELKKAFPEGEECGIDLLTYNLSCVLSNHNKSEDDKLKAIDEFRNDCFEAIKSNGMNPICKNVLKALAVFVIAAAAMVLVFSAFALAIYFAAPVAAGLTVVGVMAGLLTGATTLSIAALATSAAAGLAAGVLATCGMFFKETPQEKAIDDLADAYKSNSLVVTDSEEDNKEKIIYRC